MSLGQRLGELYEALKHNNVVKNKQDFCDKLGIDYTSLNKYLKDEVNFKVTADIFRKFPIYSLNLGWILDGQGNMFLDEQSQTTDSTAAVTLKEALPIIAELADLTAEQKQEILDFIKEIKK